MPSFKYLHEVLSAGGIVVPANKDSRVTCAFWGGGANHYIGIRRYCLHEAPSNPEHPELKEVRLYEGDLYPPNQPWTNASDWPLPKRTATEFNVNSVVDFIPADVDTWLYCYCSDHEPTFRKRKNEPPYKMDEIFYGVDTNNSNLAALQFRIYIGEGFPPVSSLFAAKPKFFEQN